MHIFRCPARDVDDVMGFIDAHWKRGHPLATHRSLVDWQHREEGFYNFVVARGPSGGPIWGILGYIPTRRYDPSLSRDNALWYALWKVREDCPDKGLGLRMLNHLHAIEPASLVGTVGINERVAQVYRLMRYQVGLMDHFYLPNTELSDFRIACFPEGPGKEPPGDAKAVRLLDLTRTDLLEAPFTATEPRANAAPTKTAAFFAHRYFDTPGFSYRVLGVERSGRLRALLALRRAEAEGSAALRVVDFLGEVENLASAAPALSALVREEEAEYLDVICHGLDPDTLVGAGFRHLAMSGPIIVPNHFSPFERANKPLRFAVKTSRDQPAVLFKADADQDRPPGIDPSGSEEAPLQSRSRDRSPGVDPSGSSQAPAPPLSYLKGVSR